MECRAKMQLDIIQRENGECRIPAPSPEPIFADQCLMRIDLGKLAFIFITCPARLPRKLMAFARSFLTLRFRAFT
jgi:hypothetical protein